MSDATLSNNTLVKRGNGAGTEVFTTIAEVTDFTAFGGSAPVVPVTHLNSTAVEKLLGLRDEGQFSFNANFIGSDDQQQGLVEDREDRVLRNFEIVFSDGSEAAFSAFVTIFSISGTEGQALKVAVTLEISGAVAWTFAS